MYYGAFDLIVSVIDKRFNQKIFSSYAQMETLLVTIRSLQLHPVLLESRGQQNTGV